MFKQRINVLVGEQHNNFDILKPMVEIGDTEVFLVDKPSYRNDGNNVIKNFDCGFYVPTYDSTEHLKYDESCIANDRMPKSVQFNILNDIANKLKIKNFRQTETLYFKGKKISNALPTKPKYILKMEYGARGVNQFIIDTSKAPLTETVGQIFDNDYKDDINTSKKLIDWIEKTFKNNEVVYLNGSPNFDGEAFTSISKDDMILQEFVDNVKSEHRLIKMPNGDVYCSDRSYREYENGYKQATGADGVYHEFKLIDGSNKFDVEIIQMVSCIPNFPFGSLDLFYTNDDKFGFFEFSCQFGHSAMSYELKKKIHIDVLKYLIKNKLGLDL